MRSHVVELDNRARITNSETTTPKFTKFPELPVELQLRIFEHAIPDPRSIEGVVIIIIGRKLNNPRAFLPDIREFKEAYRHANQDVDFDVDDDDLVNELWDPANPSMRESREFVINILHTCRTARTVALATYRLGIDSIIPEENMPWWNPELDNLYFQLPPTDEDGCQAVLHWLIGDSESFPKTGSFFESVQNVTLCLDRSLANMLGLGYPVAYKKLGGLLSLPSLESLNLLLDPCRLGKSTHGSIIYYEPENVPVDICHRERPAELQAAAQNTLKRTGPKDREIPDVNLFVMGIKLKNKTITWPIF